MKKSVVFGLLFVLLCGISVVFAQEEEPFENPTYTEEFIEQQENMLFNLDKLFPRILVKDTFDTPSGPFIDQLEGFSFTTQDRLGREELSINAYRINKEKDYNYGWNLFPRTGSYSNFYLYIEIQMIEQDDSNSGFCWFQYSDVSIVGNEKRSAVTIDFPNSIYKYTSKPSGRIFTTLYDLSEYEHDYDKHSLEIIRLDGYTSMFIDRKFILGFDDELQGRFSHLYGVGIKPGGEYATIAFDNFIIRRQ